MHISYLKHRYEAIGKRQLTPGMFYIHVNKEIDPDWCKFYGSACHWMVPGTQTPLDEKPKEERYIL
jgi:hypothetical protein